MVRVVYKQLEQSGTQLNVPVETHEILVGDNVNTIEHRMSPFWCDRAVHVEVWITQGDWYGQCPMGHFGNWTRQTT